MKFLIFKILIIAIIFNFIISDDPAPSAISGDSGVPKTFKNEYKDDRKVKHSLFREKDSMERLSVEAVGIPLPLNRYIYINTN